MSVAGSRFSNKDVAMRKPWQSVRAFFAVYGVCGLVEEKARREFRNS